MPNIEPVYADHHLILYSEMYWLRVGPVATCLNGNVQNVLERLSNFDFGFIEAIQYDYRKQAVSLELYNIASETLQSSCYCEYLPLCIQTRSNCVQARHSDLLNTPIQIKP